MKPGTKIGPALLIKDELQGLPSSCCVDQKSSGKKKRRKQGSRPSRDSLTEKEKKVDGKANSSALTSKLVEALISVKHTVPKPLHRDTNSKKLKMRCAEKTMHARHLSQRVNRWLGFY
jgi:hypothetical protein